MPQGIFIVGWGRSGTTWLGNLLLQHPQLCGISHDRTGIFESAWFSHVDGRFGDISDAACYGRLVDVLEHSYYFRHLGETRDSLMARYPVSYAELFRQTMDDFCLRNGARDWVEKTPGHSLCLERIASALPQAKFLALTRDLRDVVISRLGILEHYRLAGHAPAGRWPKHHSILGSTLTWHHYTDCLNRAADRWPDRVMSLTYEGLKQDTLGELRRVCRFLEVEEPERPPVIPFQPNSSFTKGGTVEYARLEAEFPDRCFRFCDRMARCLPEAVLSGLYRKATKSDNDELPFFFFRDDPGLPPEIQNRRW